MKKLILTLAMAGAMLAVKAQETPNRNNTDMEVSTQMKKDLQLNDNQYHQVQSINQKKLERLREIESMYASDPVAREAKISEIDQEADLELSDVLSEKQYNAYLELHGKTTEATELDTMPVENTLDETRTDDIKIKSEEDELKIKKGSEKLKVEDDELKLKQEGTKIKVEGDERKYKSDDTKLKAEPGKTKIEQGDNKTKIKDDKVKVKSSDSKHKTKH